MLALNARLEWSGYSVLSPLEVTFLQSKPLMSTLPTLYILNKNSICSIIFATDFVSIIDLTQSVNRIKIKLCSPNIFHKENAAFSGKHSSLTGSIWVIGIRAWMASDTELSGSLPPNGFGSKSTFSSRCYHKNI